MSKNPLNHSVELYEYLKAHSGKESPEQKGLREVTQGMEMALMQISPDQGQFMALLVKLINANTIVEVGTFTGYSALSMAQALPDDGRLIACDVSTEWTDVGKPFWERAGVDHKIDLRIAPATDTLQGLLDGGMAGTVDLIFIDADKPNYKHYYELGISLLRQNGLIAIDNVFWDGAVVDEKEQGENTVAIREINDIVANDQRVEATMIAVGDGLYLVRKI